MTIPVARLGDTSTPDPCLAPPRPTIVGSGDVFVNGLAAHRLGDSWAPHSCVLPTPQPPHQAVTSSGSGSVYVNGKPLARVGDTISCGSVIATGSGNVFAG